MHTLRTQAALAAAVVTMAAVTVAPAAAQIIPTYDARWVEVSYQITQGEVPWSDYRYLNIDSCQWVGDDDSVSENASYDLTLLLDSGDCANTLNLPGFSHLEDMLLAGDARIVSPGVLRVTPEEGGRNGAAWYPAKTHLAEGFDLLFQFQLSPDTGSRGDGFAFVIQDDGPFAIGSGGSGLGYAGIARSLAVEFDTFAFGAEFARDHVSVQTQGIAGNSSDDSASVAHAVLPSTVADGGTHTCRLIYTPGQLDVYLDDAPVLTAPVDLQGIGGESILDANGCARIGFTAGTGLANSAHDILSLAMNVACSDSLAYPGFAASSGLTLLADAAVVDANTLRLTPAEVGKRGAAWHNDTIHLSDGFTTGFTFRISTDDPPADGMAFVIQAEGPDALGGGGHAMGYAENDVPAIRSHLAVAIRPHWWAPGEYEIRVDTDLGDPGAGELSLAAAWRTGIIWDGLPHDLLVKYTPGELLVYLDGGDPILAFPVYLNDIGGRSVLDANGCAWVGFTAATGGFFSAHDVLDWWLSGPCFGPVPGDFDGDCDIDQDDLGLLTDCAQGPAVPYLPGCEDRDLDLDGDVDQVDFGMLQRCHSGPGRPADPTCATLPPGA